MNLPNRKPNRLKDYDYSKNGAYFITICTKDKKEILSHIETNLVGADTIRPQISAGNLLLKPEIILTKYGLIIDNAIKEIPTHYGGVFVDNYVIMPNHIHLIIRIENNGRTVSAPTIIGSMKRYVSKQTNESIWQKSFYDHIIRDENDYKTKWEYIENNPNRWSEDELYNGN